MPLQQVEKPHGDSDEASHGGHTAEHTAEAYTSIPLLRVPIYRQKVRHSPNERARPATLSSLSSVHLDSNAHTLIALLCHSFPSGSSTATERSQTH